MNKYGQTKWLLMLLYTHFLLSFSQADISLLTSVGFHDNIDTFDLIVDARSVEEYDKGHIQNATVVPELGLLNGVTLQQQEAAIDRLKGCQFCRVVVYSSTARKAMFAAEQLETIGGFKHLFNGLGVTEWATAGYPLVTSKTRSYTSPCLAARQSYCARNSAVVVQNENNNSESDNNSKSDVPEKKIVPRSADKDAFKLYTEKYSQGNIRRRKGVRG